jgi:hypothetical protein
VKKRVHFVLGAVLATTFSIGAMVAAEQPASELHLQPESNRPPDSLTADQQAALEQKENACEGCHLVRGKVLRNDFDKLVVRDSKKKEIEMKFDKHTRLGQVDPKNATFIEGDRIEALLTADGRIWSVTQLKQQSNQPGVDAEGD